MIGMFSLSLKPLSHGSMIFLRSILSNGRKKKKKKSKAKDVQYTMWRVLLLLLLFVDVLCSCGTTYGFHVGVDRSVCNKVSVTASH